MTDLQPNESADLTPDGRKAYVIERATVQSIIDRITADPAPLLTDDEWTIVVLALRHWQR